MAKQFINKICAFTLAETLITLSIIGVVAVLTLPGLTENYRVKAWNTAADTFSARLSDAIYQMAQIGKMDGYNSTLEFVNELNNYINFKNICGPNDLTNCFTAQFTEDGEIFNTVELTNSGKLGQADFGTEVIGFNTNFGVNGIMSYDSKCKTSSMQKISGTPCVSYIIDTNSLKAPNKVKSDIRMANASLFPCSKFGSYCVKFFSRDEIKQVDCRNSNSSADDYKYCGTHPSDRVYDSWAGANKICAKTGLKLPTLATLQAFYNAYHDQEEVPKTGWMLSFTEYIENPYNPNFGIYAVDFSDGKVWTPSKIEPSDFICFR